MYLEREIEKFISSVAGTNGLEEFNRFEENLLVQRLREEIAKAEDRVTEIQARKAKQAQVDEGTYKESA